VQILCLDRGSRLQQHSNTAAIATLDRDRLSDLA
jgi:hypothetical protein